MANTTTNYGWVKPVVGGDGDAWGGEINNDLDGIDSVVHSIQTSIPAAYVLPTASTTILGGVKVDGTTITITGGGVISGAASGASVTVSDTAPSSPKNGDLWFDSVGGQTYLWYTDPNTSQWVIVVNASGGPVVRIGDLPPANPVVGQLYWDSVGAQLYVYYNDGSSAQWVPTSNQLGAGYLAKQGVTDGSDAPAGQIGEVISSVVTTGVTLTNATAANVTSISLTPGDWDVQGEVWFNVGTANATLACAAIGPNSVTLPTTNSISVSRSQISTTIVLGNICAMICRPCRVSISAATIYYLLGYLAFPSGTCTATGNIWARRAR